MLHRTLIVLLVLAASSVATAQSGDPFEVRPFRPFIGNEWIGNAISYGPYRDGQRPGGKSPTRAQMREDLKIMAKHWKLIRIYGTEVGRAILEVIREEKLPMRVIVGAWITREYTESPDGKKTPIAGARQANERQSKGAVELANAFPDVVIATSVGNETQVFWSDHKTDPDVLLRHLRYVRQRTGQPVTTADDFNFWNKPESQRVAAEVDFVIVHIHALWAGLPIERAMQWTDRIYREIVGHHPLRQVVIGEAGWATAKHTEGEQAKLIKGTPNDANQARYYRELRAWAKKHKITTFNFEAFDENWKGGPHPSEVEKHWGVFRADRTPKPAISGR